MRLTVPLKALSIWIMGSLVGTSLPACSPLPNASQLEYEGSRVALSRSSGKSPTVVFQPGLGDGMSAWSAVLERLPSDVATFAYDRPGYGGSTGTLRSRDPCSVARELHTILHISGVAAPYLLVGHSLGGLYQYAFAMLYPEEVAGVILVDATHPDNWPSMQRRSPRTAAALRWLRAIVFSDTEKREFDAQTECTAELKTKSPPTIPARLLSRGKVDLTESPEFQSMSRDLASRWPELIPGMTLLRAEGAGHYIQNDRPELVATEIGIMVAIVRGKHL